MLDICCCFNWSLYFWFFFFVELLGNWRKAVSKKCSSLARIFLFLNVGKRRQNSLTKIFHIVMPNTVYTVQFFLKWEFWPLYFSRHFIMTEETSVKVTEFPPSPSVWTYERSVLWVGGGNCWPSLTGNNLFSIVFSPQSYDKIAINESNILPHG